MKPETKIENDFVSMVESSLYSAMAIKLKLFAGRGWPDRTILGHGKCFFIEFKTPDNKDGLESQQIKWKKLLIRLGFNYYVCTSKEEAYKVFKKEMDTP